MGRPVETIRRVALASIDRDAGTQMRARLNVGHVASIIEAMERGRHFAEPDVFDDGERLVLADGFHRVRAFELRGVLDINVRVHHGDIDDAVTFAAHANEDSRLSYSNEDKRRAVDAMLRIHTDWTNSRIAEHCHVDENTVANRRPCESAHLDPVPELPGPKLSPRKPVAVKREGRDGKQYASEGKKVAGARKQYENALAKIAAAGSLMDLRDAMDRGETALGKLPEDPARAGELYRLYEDRRRTLGSQPVERAIPRAGAVAPPTTDERSLRVRAFIRACHELHQRAGELLHDAPIAHVSPALRADCEDIVGRVIARLRERVVDAAPVLTMIPGGKGAP